MKRSWKILLLAGIFGVLLCGSALAADTAGMYDVTGVTPKTGTGVAVTGEAATIDGASRFQKMAYITLPGLKPTILMLFIMKIGSLVNGASFDLSYLLGNTLNASRSDILSTYILKTGISQGRFSYATALGLIESCTMLLLVVTANGIVNKVSGEGLF